MIIDLTTIVVSVGASVVSSSGVAGFAVWFFRQRILTRIRREEERVISDLRREEIRSSEFHSRATIVYAQTYEKLYRSWSSLEYAESSLELEDEQGPDVALEEQEATSALCIEAREYFLQRALYFPDACFGEILDFILEVNDLAGLQLDALNKRDEQINSGGGDEAPESDARELALTNVTERLHKIREQLRALIGGS